MSERRYACTPKPSRADLGAESLPEQQMTETKACESEAASSVTRLIHTISQEMMGLVVADRSHKAHTTFYNGSSAQQHRHGSTAGEYIV